MSLPLASANALLELQEWSRLSLLRLGVVVSTQRGEIQ